MISIYPSTYNRFTCKAGVCKHTCCQTWEIDIDAETVAFYQQLDTSLGQEIRQAMRQTEDGWCFKLGADNKCQLLREDGLCPIVLELGEEALGAICHNHPRFYKYIENLELCGVGLACERTCELLLGMEALSYVAVADSQEEFLYLQSVLGKTKLNDINDIKDIKDIKDIYNLSVREKQVSLLDVGEGQFTSDLYDEQETINKSGTEEDIHLKEVSLKGLADIVNILGIEVDSCDLQFEPGLTVERAQVLLERYGALESLQETWITDREVLQKQLGKMLVSYKEMTSKDIDLYNRLYTYILYRQLDALSQYEWPILLDYAWDATEYIVLLTALNGDLLRQTARWSEEIEYDEDNVKALLQSYAEEYGYE